MSEPVKCAECGGTKFFRVRRTPEGLVGTCRQSGLVRAFSNAAHVLPAAEVPSESHRQTMALGDITEDFLRDFFGMRRR